MGKEVKGRSVTLAYRGQREEKAERESRHTALRNGGAGDGGPGGVFFVGGPGGVCFGGRGGGWGLWGGGGGGGVWVSKRKKREELHTRRSGIPGR